MAKGTALSSRKLRKHEGVDDFFGGKFPTSDESNAQNMGSHPTFKGMTTGGYLVIILKIKENTVLIKVFIYWSVNSKRNIVEIVYNTSVDVSIYLV